MPSAQIMTIANLALIAASLAVLGNLLFRGELRERRLRLAPTRDLHQPAWVYTVAVLGVLLYSGLKLTMHPGQPLGVLLLVETMPFALAGLLIGRAIHSEAGFRKIGLLPRWPMRDAAWGLIGGLVGLGLAGGAGMAVGYLSELMGQPVDPVAHEALRQLREDFTVELLIALSVSAVIMAPLIEEIVFRGVFQTSLLRLFKEMRWPALLVAAAVFSAIHWSVVQWQGLVPLFVLGLVFGYLYERTGSLLTPILAHAVFNAANITIALLLPEQLSQ